MASVTVNPVTVSRKVVRHQTFRISRCEDFRSLIGQLSFLLQQLQDSRFTGKVELDFSQGTLLSANTIDSQKIDL